MNDDLCFIDEDGGPRNAVIYEPLLRILLPAFNQGAEAVYILYTREVPGCISATYKKGLEIIPLHVESNFSPADVFARLRIICGISIVAEGHLTGETKMRFNVRIFRVSVEIDTDAKQEVINFKFHFPTTK